jgi:hypothetical protein
MDGRIPKPKCMYCLKDRAISLPLGITDGGLDLSSHFFFCSEGCAARYAVSTEHYECAYWCEHCDGWFTDDAPCCCRDGNYCECDLD